MTPNFDLRTNYVPKLMQTRPTNSSGDHVHVLSHRRPRVNDPGNSWGCCFCIRVVLFSIFLRLKELVRGYTEYNKRKIIQEGVVGGREGRKQGWGGMLQLYSLQSPVGLVRKNSCEIIIWVWFVRQAAQASPHPSVPVAMWGSRGVSGGKPEKMRIINLARVARNTKPNHLSGSLWHMRPVSLVPSSVGGTLKHLQ